MIIQKVINNNVVSTFDSNGKEVILMGKGIGFRKKTGDELDKTKIELIILPVFVLNNAIHVLSKIENTSTPTVTQLNSTADG